MDDSHPHVADYSPPFILIYHLRLSVDGLSHCCAQSYVTQAISYIRHIPCHDVLYPLWLQ